MTAPTADRTTVWDAQAGEWVVYHGRSRDYRKPAPPGRGQTDGGSK